MVQGVVDELVGTKALMSKQRSFKVFVDLTLTTGSADLRRRRIFLIGLLECYRVERMPKAARDTYSYLVKLGSYIRDFGSD